MPVLLVLRSQYRHLFYFFENQLTYVRDLMVGYQGNIPSCYSKSRQDIEKICNEFINRVAHLEGNTNE